MSPEQASGGRIDARTDVYSTGLLLFELLVGEPPFFSDQAFHVIRMHVEEPPPALRDRAPEAGFSDELEAVVARALAKSPDERFQTPGELSEALARVPEAGGGAPRAVGRVASRPERAPLAHAPTVIASAAKAPPAPSEPVAAPRRGRTGRRPPTSRWIPRLLVAAAAASALWYFVLRPERRADLAQAFQETSQEVKEKVEALGRDVAGRDVAAPTAGEPPAEPATRARAEALASAGDPDGALRILHELRRKDPGDARVWYLLGRVYHDKGWGAEALAAYREAIGKDRSLARDPSLVRQVVAMLGDASLRGKARVCLVKDIGEAALPELRRASGPKSPPQLRKEARAVAQLIQRAR